MTRERGSDQPSGLSPQRLRQFYEVEAAQRNHWSAHPEEVFVRLDRLRYEAILRRLTRRYRRAADLGCGSGMIAARLMENAETVLALDLTHARLRQVRENAGGACFVQGDLGRLPLKDNSLDLIVVSEVIEHLPDYKPALTEIRRALTPLGTCVISVPYREDLEEHVCPHCLRAFPLHGHFHRFDERILADALDSVGLSSTGFLTLNNAVATRLGRLFKAGYSSLRALDWACRRIAPHMNRHLILFAEKRVESAR